MELNKRILIPILILLVISWTGNTIYYNSHKLREPLFLKHYYDVKGRGASFQLYYVNNLGSNVDVVGITFPEIGQEYVLFDKGNYNNDGKYYEICRITVTLNGGNVENIPENLKNKVITKAQIQLTNGKTMDIDLGKIYIYSDESGEVAHGTSINMGSNDYSGSTNFGGGKYIKINGVSSKFPEILKDSMNVYVNGKILEDTKFPIELELGDNLQASYDINFKKDDIRRNYAYDFSLDFLLEDRTGTKSISYMPVKYWLHQPEQLDIKALKKERGY